MRTDTVDDWKSRVQVAEFEASDFNQLLMVAYWVLAIVAGIGIAVAHWFFAASLPVLILISACFVILSVGMMLAEAARRHYLQCAFTQMTVSHLESEIERMHNKLDRIVFDAEKAAKAIGR